MIKKYNKSKPKNKKSPSPLSTRSSLITPPNSLKPFLPHPINPILLLPPLNGLPLGLLLLLLESPLSDLHPLVPFPPLLQNLLQFCLHFLITGAQGSYLGLIALQHL